MNPFKRYWAKIKYISFFSKFKRYNSVKNRTGTKFKLNLFTYSYDTSIYKIWVKYVQRLLRYWSESKFPIFSKVLEVQLCQKPSVYKDTSICQIRVEIVQRLLIWMKHEDENNVIKLYDIIHVCIINQNMFGKLYLLASNIELRRMNTYDYNNYQNCSYRLKSYYFQRIYR